MRKITLKVYSFGELPSSLQEKIVKEYNVDSEYNISIKEFKEHADNFSYEYFKNGIKF